MTDMNIEVRFKKISENAVKPSKAHRTDAGYDLTPTSVEDMGNGLYLYHFGIAIETEKVQGCIPYYQLHPRSSTAKKYGLILTNSVGVIDEPYRGEIMALMWHFDKTKPLPSIGVGASPICQLIFQSTQSLNFVEVEKLGDTERGKGGYGSSDIKTK